MTWISANGGLRCRFASGSRCFGCGHFNTTEAHGIRAPMASKSAHVWVQCPDVEKAWESLNRHTEDVLAGGWIAHQRAEAPCCASTGSATGTCPKAKWNAGEDLPTAAAREVHEECGVPLAHCRSAHLPKPIHIYGRKDDKMKVTQWYAMAPSPGTEDVQLQPQTEEGITEVRWAMPQEVATMEPDAFGNIARLMSAWRASQ